MSDGPKIIEHLKSERAALKACISALEFDLVRSRKTIDGLLAQDLKYSEENARLKERLSNAHRHIRYDCACNVCVEVERSQTELDGLWLSE